MQNTYKGILQALFSSVFFGMLPFFTIPLYSFGYSGEYILFYRFLFAGTAMFFILFFKRQLQILSFKTCCYIFIQSLAYCLNTLILFAALRYADSGIVTTVFFTNPVFVLFFSAFFFKEKISCMKFILILITCLGVAVLSGIFEGNVQGSFKGISYSLLSGFGYAVYIVLLTLFPTKNVPQDLFSLYLFCFAAMISGTAVCFNGQMEIPQFQAFFYLFGSAVFTTIFANGLLIRAITNIGSVMTAVFGVMEPITAVLIGIAVFHEKFSLNTAFGIIIIIISIILITILPSKKNKDVQAKVG